MGREVFVWRDGKVVPKHEAAPKESGPYYVPDEAPFLSPMDFKTVIGGRRQRKDMERAYGVRQVGTDQKLTPREPYRMPSDGSVRWVDPD